MISNCLRFTSPTPRGALLFFNRPPFAGCPWAAARIPGVAEFRDDGGGSMWEEKGGLLARVVGRW